MDLVGGEEPDREARSVGGCVQFGFQPQPARRALALVMGPSFFTLGGKAVYDFTLVKECIIHVAGIFWSFSSRKNDFLSLPVEQASKMEIVAKVSRK